MRPKNPRQDEIDQCEKDIRENTVFGKCAQISELIDEILQPINLLALKILKRLLNKK